MARSKQQWRAEKLALRLAARAPVPPPAEMVRLKTEHPHLCADAPQLHPQPQPASPSPSPSPAPPPVAALPATVIDLTAEEGGEEEIDIEAMRDVEADEREEGEEVQAVGISPARPSIERPSSDGGEESDVDEAWPGVTPVNGEEGARTPETPGLEGEEGVRGESGGDNKAPTAEPETQRTSPVAMASSVLLLDEDEMEEDEALPVVTTGLSGPPSRSSATVEAATAAPAESTEASGEDDVAMATPSTDWAGRIARLVETAAIEEESLEDGEIFEEGAVAPSPTAVKRVIALERLASREDSGSDASAPPAQQPSHAQGQKKKHKKRGKKKSKRKLEAMAMDAADAETPPAGFERVVRFHSLASELSESHDAAPPPAPVMAIPALSHPPPSFRAPPLPPLVAPEMPRAHHALPSYRQFDEPLPQQHLPLRPPYQDNQMLRVNRQGTVEMFGGNGRVLPPPPPFPSSHVAAPPPHGPVVGGFKYRSIPPRMPPPFPMMRRVQQPFHGESDASISPSPNLEAAPFHRDKRLGSSTSTASIASSGSEEPPAREDAGLDLDMLRAMALRTKRVSRLQPSERPAAAADATEAAGNGAAALSTASEAAPTSATSRASPTDTDSLDESALLAMIRSSQKRKRQQRQTHPWPQPSASAAPTGSGSDCRQSDESAAHDRADKSEEDEAVADALPVSSVQVSASSDVTLTEKPLSPPLSANKATTDGVAAALTELPPTPVVRPLTACSQSLVIQLDEDDLTLADDDDAAVLHSPRSTAASAQSVTDMRSAIDAMRRQIAEREKARTGVSKGSTLTPSSSASSSSAASSGASSLRTSPRPDAPKKAKTMDLNRSVPASTAPSSSASSSSNTSSPSRSSPAALQAEIRAMKERIAAKEREKRRQHDHQRELPASGSAARVSSGDAGEAGEQPKSSVLERYRRRFEACKVEMDESRRQLALADAEVARLERELAAVSRAAEPAQSNAVETRG